MIGSDTECKSWTQDFVPFNKKFNPNWEALYQRWLSNNKEEWCIFENDVIHFARNGIIKETHKIPNAYTHC
jgi:hypothetical protein